MNILKKIITKEILYKTNYLTYTKSMLHLPIFTTSKNKIEDTAYHLIIPALDGFKNINLRFPPLSIKNDFMVFSYILKLFYKNCDNNLDNPYEIEFSFNDLFDFYDIERRNRTAYSKTIVNSISKLSRVNLTFIRNEQLFICNFIGSAELDLTKKRNYKISIIPNFINFFKHDKNVLFNINLDIYKILEKDFSKILYLYYITNLHKIGKENVASFDRDLIFMRLQSAAKDKKVLELIKEANQELIDKKLIKGYSFSKSGNRITKINIVYLSKNANQAIEEAKQEEIKEEVKEEELKTDVSGFDNDNFIDKPEDDELPF